MTDDNFRFAELSVPGPTRTSVTEPFWRAVAAHRFEIQRCDNCGEHVFYPRRICPHCWHDALKWVEASGRATVRSFSVVHRPGHPGWNGVAPYPIAMLTLAEGPTMLSHLLASPADITIGMPVTVCFTHVGNETLPFFAPDGAADHTKGQFA